ncbi:hypothetical protein AGMMS49965_24770 [Bacteroidia bacterium]|nr:hypothetical protein AGMMS49965_24770 [Bacteroidia bacterium]
MKNSKHINKLILGDNLDVLKTLPDESVDLIYLDPPFLSNRNYEVIWGDEGEVRSFEDRWSGGMQQYIAWLNMRVVELYRILKQTGSMFLHCDISANSYIRCDILDKLFEGDNLLRGEIIWCRANSHNDAKNKLATLSDTIWYYSKSNTCCYNPILTELSEKYINDFYRYDDKDGKGLYQLDNIASPNPRPNLMYEYKGYSYPSKGWRFSKEKMEELDENGLLYFPADKKDRIRKKRYLSETNGTLMGNVWTDIQNVQGSSKEHIGYPTQKPEELLQRIIEMASNEGDVVLDPFVGGGTTIAVADKMNRKWIGIDQSVMAIKVSDQRLKKQAGMFSQPYDLVLRKYDYDLLRHKDAFEFESWIITQFGGKPNAKQRSDRGIDGKAADGAPIQVKRSDNIGVNVVKNFWASLQQFDQKLFDKNVAESKTAGYIIAFSFGKGAVEEVARLRNKNKIIIELKRVDEIVDYGKKPSVSLSKSIINENEYMFIAEAESEIGIEFYSWDFNHDDEIGFRADKILDKDGKQIRKFPEGEHQIAVEATDTQGLSGTDKVKIKVKK